VRFLAAHFSHHFKPADLEKLAMGDKNMPKAIGASSTATV
jgi:hypothetical protein